MPTYEYRCPACGTDFEKFQRMSEDPVAPCPKCGVNAERRLSGGAGFLFKGSGFYITDYRSDNYRKEAGSDKPGGEPKPAANETGGSAGGSTSGSKASGDGGSGGSPPASKAE